MGLEREGVQHKGGGQWAAVMRDFETIIEEDGHYIEKLFSYIILSVVIVFSPSIEELFVKVKVSSQMSPLATFCHRPPLASSGPLSPKP